MLHDNSLSKEESQYHNGSAMTMTTNAESIAIFLFGKKGKSLIDWGNGIVEEVIINNDNLSFSYYMNNDKRVKLKYAHTYSDKSTHTITITGDNITHAEFGSNQLTSLDVSKNTALILLNCFENQLTDLNVSNNTRLMILRCDKNQLTNFDLSKNTALTRLNCGANQLVSLDVSKNTALVDLLCFENQLTSLDVDKNTALIQFWCYKNKLTSLDVSKNTALSKLKCKINQLTNLDVSQNTVLKTLNCGANQLMNLDVSRNTELVDLFCFENQLTSLDVTQNTSLVDLNCSSNQLTNLDVSKNTLLTELKCHKNRITNLNVSKNISLILLKCYYNRLTSLDVSKNTALTELDCSNNQLTNLDLSKNRAITKFISDFAGLKAGGTVAISKTETTKKAKSKKTTLNFLNSLSEIIGWLILFWLVFIVVCGIFFIKKFWLTFFLAWGGLLLILGIDEFFALIPKSIIKRRIKQGDLNAQVELGVYFMKKLKLDKAQIEFEKAYKQGSKSPKTYFNLGDILMRRQYFNDAQKWFEIAASQGHTDAQSKINECIQKITEKKEKEVKRGEEAKRKAAEEAARPRCAYCNRVLDTDSFSKWGAVVETQNGPRFYCSRMCKVNDGYGGQGY